MIIGTVRPEEAKVFDTMEGYHQFHEVESQEPYGSFEVFWHDRPKHAEVSDTLEDSPSGWYWHACYPGCLPDAEPSGPFASSRQAHEDADPWSPDYDD